MDTPKYYLWFVFLSIFKINCAYILLFKTEDTLSTQTYDCIYYTNITAGNNETTPYCIRTNDSVSLKRSFTHNICKNSGQEWTFKILKDMNISQDEVLKWNSSIEMVDEYAAYLTTGLDQFADEKICNCSLGTFGKFCEYEFMTKTTFEDTIQYQFDLKLKYRIGSQLWGNMTCYLTLTNCNSGLQCLTWHNICDGKQQCMDGIDEDHCEELELNECEANEYRCLDGSCISEQYWLDGEYDCSDMSDEQEISKYVMNPAWCPITSSQFSCDEITFYHKYFACGDGEFMWASPVSTILCYNYRRKMFFCEYKWSSDDSAMWTRENGHCVNKGWREKNLTDMNELEKCIFFLKCQLTNGKHDDCDEASREFYVLCKDKHVKYPSGSFFKPYFQTVYVLNESKSFSNPTYTYFNGSVKCIGYQARTNGSKILLDGIPQGVHFRFDFLLCNEAEQKDVFGPQFDKHCWNNTKQSFLCLQSHRCISTYRVHDGYNDCYWEEDRQTVQQYQIKQPHRFYCPDNPSKSLLVSAIGTEYIQCGNGADEYLPQLNWILFDHKCTRSNLLECKVLRAYVQSPSSIMKTEYNKILVFRQYCDTVWQLPSGSDESFCNEWKCPQGHYQCLSGHCIPIIYVTDQSTYKDWHCPDASNNIGLLRVTQLSEHNKKLINQYR